VVAEVGLAFDITCGYDAQGTLQVARRCDRGSALFCGSQCLTSAAATDPDGGAVTLCGPNSLAKQCTVDGGAPN
jgi:hypothetical protein